MFFKVATKQSWWRRTVTCWRCHVTLCSIQCVPESSAMRATGPGVPIAAWSAGPIHRLGCTRLGHMASSTCLAMLPFSPTSTSCVQAFACPVSGQDCATRFSLAMKNLCGRHWRSPTGWMSPRFRALNGVRRPKTSSTTGNQRTPYRTRCTWHLRAAAIR